MPNQITAGGGILLLRYRWLILLIFLPIIFCSEFRLAVVDDSVTWCGLGGMSACMLLLAHLNRPVRESLWAWVLLFVFMMGYFVNFLYFAWTLGTPIFYDLEMAEMGWLNDDYLREGLVWSTMGFSLFCCVATALLRRRSTCQTAKHGVCGAPSTLRVLALLMLALSIATITAILPILFGFGQMGVEHQYLPYRIDALITRSRTILVPAILLLLLYVCDTPKTRRYWWLSFFAFIFSPILNSFVTTSRSSVLLSAIPLLFLWWMSDKLTRWRLRLIGVGLICTIVTFPFFSNLRSLRIHYGAFSWDQINLALASPFTTDVLELVLLRVFTRVSGFGGLLHNIHYWSTQEGGALHPSHLLWLLDHSRIAQFQTYEVVGIQYGLVEGRSAGLLGAFALVGGSWAIIGGTIVFTLLSCWCWQRLRRLEVAPVALAIFANMLLFYASEGVMGFQDPISCAIAILVIVKLYRWLIPEGYAPVLT